MNIHYQAQLSLLLTYLNLLAETMPAVQIAYVSNKRERVSQCNLCGNTRQMTWDHVPPKGGIEITRVEMRAVINRISPNAQPIQPRQSQDGLKFRTLCGGCNNLLGREYDPTLNDLALGVGRIMKSPLVLPSTIRYTTKPARLIRGILGHLVAAKVERDAMLQDERVREVFFNPSAQFHRAINIHYWIYPYADTIVMRDFMRGSRNPNSDMAFCSVLKYFPIAYAITDKESFEELSSLSAYRNYGIDDEAEIPIQLDSVKPYYWPEHPQDNTTFILAGRTGSQGIRAVPR